jgi:hypothetical protein
MVWLPAGAAQAAATRAAPKPRAACTLARLKGGLGAPIEEVLKMTAFNGGPRVHEAEDMIGCARHYTPP